MACACGAAANSAKLIGLTGASVATTVIHPVFTGVAAVLIVYGLWQIARSTAYLAAGAFGIFGIAAALTPPRVMSASAMPWESSQMAGAGFYIVAAALLAYAMWRAFPSVKPAASATAIGGATLATGCSCCMVTGALAGMAVTGGASTEYLQGMPVIFWSGIAVVTAGLLWLGGLRAAMWAPAGALVVRYVPELLKLTGEWTWAGVSMRFIPNYLVSIAGSAVILYGFVVAYEVARSRPRVDRIPYGEPVLGGAGGD
ncbi:MAG: hypothetical protein ACR2G6_09860 [Gemmatimonadaceae bacterium]